MPRSLNKELLRARRNLHYIERAKAKGQDVARLQETYEKSQERLVRHHRCFVCGTEQTHPESIALWEQDRMGSECRRRFPSWQAGCGADAEAVAS